MSTMINNITFSGREFLYLLLYGVSKRIIRAGCFVAVIGQTAGTAKNSCIRKKYEGTCLIAGPFFIKTTGSDSNDGMGLHQK